MNLNSHKWCKETPLPVVRVPSQTGTFNASVMLVGGFNGTSGDILDCGWRVVLIGCDSRRRHEACADLVLQISLGSICMDRQGACPAGLRVFPDVDMFRNDIVVSGA